MKPHIWDHRMIEWGCLLMMIKEAKMGENLLYSNNGLLGDPDFVPEIHLIMT